jgi:imidazolonepropionase-like amidohydrolase
MRSDYLLRPELGDSYPTALINWYATKEGAWYADEIRKYPGFKGEAGFRESLNRASEVTRRPVNDKAHLLFGSDTPSDKVYTNPPGLNGRLEMNNWIAAGVSNEKLFRALTIDNARLLRLENKVGTVEGGKIANLLLLRANPLESIEAYDTIETALLHGRPIPRAELSARNSSE